MAQSQRVQALTQGMEFVSILREFIKDPNLGEELADEVKKLNTLTAQEEDRLHESKVLMQQRDALTAEIAAQRKTLAAEKAAHEAAVQAAQEKCDAYVAEEEAKLAKKAADLDARQADLDDYSTRLDQRECQLKEKAAVMKGLFKE